MDKPDNSKRGRKQIRLLDNTEKDPKRVEELKKMSLDKKLDRGLWRQ